MFLLFILSVLSDSLRPHEPQHARSPCPSPAPGVHQTHVHRVSDAIQPSHPLLSLPPPALNLSSIKVFSNELVLCIRWPKYWSFSFSVSPSNEYSGLIPFRIDWFYLFAVQATLKVFSIELALHIRWPKYWSFSFSVSPSNEYLGSISFRID